MKKITLKDELDESIWGWIWLIYSVVSSLIVLAYAFYIR